MNGEINLDLTKVFNFLKVNANRIGLILILK